MNCKKEEEEEKVKWGEKGLQQSRKKEQIFGAKKDCFNVRNNRNFEVEVEITTAVETSENIFRWTPQILSLFWQV